MAEYIERQALMEYAESQPSGLISNKSIQFFPAADVAPVRHGQWDGEGDGYAETEDGEMALVYDVWICSECGYTIDDGTDDPDLLPNYCPHCGAKMDAPTD